ncbi:MAG: fibronectin type III domain-containing protein [Myxococcota bacterium]
MGKSRKSLERWRVALIGGLWVAGCALDTDDPHAGTSEELFGAMSTKDCDSDQQRLLQESLRVGQIAAQDSVFQQCVLSSPYIPCDDDRSTDLAVALAVSKSPNDLHVTCKTYSNPAVGGSTGSIHDPLHDHDEKFAINRAGLTDRLAWVPIDAYANVANTIWHEVAHTHGFRHGVGDDASTYARQCGQDGTSWNAFVNSMPYIIGDCIESTALNLVDDRFQKYFGRAPTDAEEDRFAQQMADGTITSPGALNLAILTVDPPTNLRFVSATGTSATITWDDASFNEDSFEVAVRRGFSALLGPTTGPNTTAAEIDRLEPGLTYQVRVRACGVGGCSAYTPEISVTTAPTQPHPVLHAQVGQATTTSLRLSWSAAVTGPPPSFYRVTWMGGSDTGFRTTDLPASAEGFSAIHLDPDSTYSFYVRACDAHCSDSVWASGTTLAGPEPTAPSNLVITSSASGSVTLEWTDHAPRFSLASVEGWFELRYSIATTTPGLATWSRVPLGDRRTSHVFPLTVPAPHSFEIVACNAYRCSSPTNQVTHWP